MPVYTYTALDIPLVNTTQVQGINDVGQVVGYDDDANIRHGFLFTGDTYIALNDPFANNDTRAYGINDVGQIVGFYQNASGIHGFLYDPTAGIFPTPYLTLNDPLGNTTFARGINCTGQIVGYYVNASGNQGFLLSGGTYTALHDPDSIDTAAFSINDLGQIVGQYLGKDDLRHSFLYSGATYRRLKMDFQLTARRAAASVEA